MLKSKLLLVALLSICSLTAVANTTDIETLQPQTNYQQLITQRQVVDQLIEQAVNIGIMDKMVAI
ncbi:hypothetical protein [Lonepinella koalarum]|uniref:hypothetical protein n=1 Tax=Lonepinella koalarum TaxID=53417 RepID=UPI003F6DF1CC